MTLVDTSDDILKKSVKTIEGSLRRVVKKKFADKPEVRRTKSIDHMSVCEICLQNRWTVFACVCVCLPACSRQVKSTSRKS